MTPDDKKFITVPKVDYDLEQNELNELRQWLAENSYIIQIRETSTVYRVYNYVYTQGKASDDRIPYEISKAIEILNNKLAESNNQESILRERERKLGKREKEIRDSSVVPKWIRNLFK